MKNNKGFSLVELIVVIAIMAILAAVAIPTFATFITKAQVSNDVSFINDVTYVATVSNVVAHPDDDVVVSVKVAADGAIQEVNYTVDSVEVTITRANDGTINATANPATDTDVEIGKEVGGSIDWDYKFASVKKVAGTYVINPANTKEIKKIS